MALKPIAQNTVHLKSPREIEIMRAAGRIVATTIDEVRRAAGPGVTTKELDRVALECFQKHKATSTAFGYYGYPGQICISVNEEVVHGIPGPRKLKEGDLVSVDVAARWNGYVADATITFGVGKPRPEHQKLLDVTRDAMMAGIQQAHPGRRIGDISHAIQEHVEANQLEVVREFVGHGVGRSMHEPPQVPHWGPPGRGPVLKVGMCMAIEPQVVLGERAVRVLDDGWTAVTVDGAWAAHFEHTIAVTPRGPVILTLP
ncbi:MAG: type I methionyl aminopeptidase [Chloroflexi bacterium]|nr:type I methionyl aminopeptidase [Chloroflexota bacterium]